MAIHTGQITNLVSRRTGSIAISSSAAGSTTLYLDSVLDFHDAGGFVVINGLPFGYSGRNIAAGTITMSAGLAVDVPQGSPVTVFPASVEKWAVVQSDSVTPEDAVMCRVPHSLAPLLSADGQRDKDRQEKVEYTVSGNFYVLTNVLSKLPAITEDAIPDGLITETMILPGSITTPLIATNAIAAYHMQANSIDTVNLTSRAIDGMTITGALFRTAEPPNPRIEVTTEGILQYALRDGVMSLITQITDSGNKFSGSVDADDIIVRNGLELYGQDNYFGPNSKVTLRTGVGGPGTPPTVNTTYKQSDINGNLRVGFRVLYGYVKTPTDEFGYSEFFGAGKYHTGGNKYYDWENTTITESDGSVRTRLKPFGYTRIRTGAGADRMVVIGELKNNGFTSGTYPSIHAVVFDDTVCTSSGTTPPVEKTSINRLLHSFSFFRSYALGRYIDSANAQAKSSYVWASLDKNGGTDQLTAEVVYVANDTTTSSTISLNTSFSPYRVHADEVLNGITYGKVTDLALWDVGGSNPPNGNMWVIHTSHQNIILSPTASTRYTSGEWPIFPGTVVKVSAHGDIATNTFTEFGGVTISNNYNQPPPVLMRYSNWSWYGSASAHYWQFAWRGHSTKAPEWLTPASPQAIHTPVRRSWTTVTVPILPPPEAGIGASRDIDKDVFGWVLYAGTASPLLNIWRQSSPSGDPTLVSDWDVFSAIASSGTHPVTSTQGFPTASPSKIVSSASSGGFPLLEITGDGNIIGNNVTAKGTTTVERLIINDRPELKHISTPANPPAGFLAGPYAKSDTELYLKTAAGVERKIPSGSKDVTGLAIAAAANFTSATTIDRRGDVVDLYLNVTATAGVAGGNSTIVIPAAHQALDVKNKYLFVADSASGSAVLGYFSGASFIHVFARTSGQGTLGHITYIAKP